MIVLDYILLVLERAPTRPVPWEAIVLHATIPYTPKPQTQRTTRFHGVYVNCGLAFAADT